MGGTELVANLFRITQTENKLINDNFKGENKANETRYEVGRKVRKAIEDIGVKLCQKTYQHQVKA